MINYSNIPSPPLDVYENKSCSTNAEINENTIVHRLSDGPKFHNTQKVYENPESAKDIIYFPCNIYQ